MLSKLPGGKSVLVHILDVDDVEGSGMSLPVHDGSDTTGVAASSDHAKISSLELDVVHNLVGVDVQPDDIVDLQKGERCIMY